MTEAKVIHIISRLPGCEKQAADAVSSYTQKWKVLTFFFWRKNPNRKIQTFGFIHHDASPNQGPIWKNQSFLLSDICTVIPWKDCYQKQFERILVQQGWEKVSNLECPVRTPRKRDVSFLDHVYLGCTQMWNKQRYCGQLQNHVRIANFSGETEKITQKIFVFLHGLMTWLVMERSVWNDIVSWQTRRLSNSTKYLLHASMTTIFKKKKWNLLDKCHKYACKLF